MATANPRVHSGKMLSKAPEMSAASAAREQEGDFLSSETHPGIAGTLHSASAAIKAAGRFVRDYGVGLAMIAANVSLLISLLTWSPWAHLSTAVCALAWGIGGTLASRKRAAHQQ